MGRLLSRSMAAAIRGARGDGIGIADGGADDLHGASGLARGAGGESRLGVTARHLRAAGCGRSRGKGRRGVDVSCGPASGARLGRRARGAMRATTRAYCRRSTSRGFGAKRAPRPRARPSEGPTDVRFADTIGSPESGRKFPTGSVARAPLALAGTRTRIGNRGGRHRGRHGGRLHLRLGSLARDRGCRSLCTGPSRSRHAPDPQLRVDVGVSRGSTNQIARRPEIQIHEPESNARDSRIDELTRPEHP